jgi:hypothetical protein
VFKDLLRGPSNLDVMATAQDCPWVAARRSSSRVFVLAALGILLSLTGCGSATILQSSFDSSAVGSPPSPKQATGTVALGGAKDRVVIVSAPPKAKGRWAQISVPSNLYCNFSQPNLQNGTYVLTAVLYIPSGGSLVPRVEFDAGSDLDPFQILWLDFGNGTGANTVMVNGNPPPSQLTFPFDTPFTLSVTLSVNFTNARPNAQGFWSASANVNLVGAGGRALGSTSVPNLTFSIPQTSTLPGFVQFHATYPSSFVGSFDVTDIIVTLKSSGTGPFPPTRQP